MRSAPFSKWQPMDVNFLIEDIMTKRMLIVESDPTAVELYEQWLRELGFQVSAVSDGGQAMQALRHHSIDGLILDLEVPVMNGITMLTQLRQRYADVTVIVLATVEMTDLLLEALESGAQDYLTKPVSQHLFKQKCRRVFLSGEQRFINHLNQENGHTPSLAERKETRHEDTA